MSNVFEFDGVEIDLDDWKNREVRYRQISPEADVILWRLIKQSPELNMCLYCGIYKLKSMWCDCKYGTIASRQAEKMLAPPQQKEGSDE